MSEQNTGGPAFPCMPPQDMASGSATGYPYPDPGMTLRDYFAAKAMQTLIACVWERCGDCNHFIDSDRRVSLHLRAYEHADTMLKARQA